MFKILSWETNILMGFFFNFALQDSFSIICLKVSFE